MRNDAVGFFWDDTPPPKPPKKEKEKRKPPEPVWLSPDYLPGLEEARAFPVDIMSIEDLTAARMQRDEFINDVEVYQNYFLSVFTNLRTGAVTYVECIGEDAVLSQEDRTKLKWLLESFCIVTFNGISYDIPMNEMAVHGCTCAKLKEHSDTIIIEQVRGMDIRRKYKGAKLAVDHIDLIEVAPLFGSLKAYAGRMHATKMQDLPFHPTTILSDDQITITRYYCVNDTRNTVELRQILSEQIELRYNLSNEYRIDLRSKSDAQIAETVIASELTKRTGIRPDKPSINVGTAYRYKTPAFIQYQSPIMRWALSVVQQAIFVVGEHGSINMPAEVKELAIDINGSVYRMGIGGLHSSESTQAHLTDENYVIIDKDVTSYYPFIILNLGLYPTHLGPIFLDVYRGIVQRRVAAKQAGQKVIADSLKIVVNGSFGKLGSKYSILYAPNLLIQTTITGQLSLLMLIERLELAGIRVVSANTDGIAIKCHRSMLHILDTVCKQWEYDTRFALEETRYMGLYSRDVNNYIAIKQTEQDDGSWLEVADGAKNKGAYANPWASPKNLAMRLHKNPTTTIITEAAEQFLINGTAPEETVRNCNDITKFVTVRNVRGGAVKQWGGRVPDHDTPEELLRMAGFKEIARDSWVLEGETQREARYGKVAYPLAQKLLTTDGPTEYVGKVVRWYYAKDVEGELIYAKSGNKVPKSDGAMPLMVLPDTIPNDINYDWYIQESYRVLRDIGAIPQETETE